MSDVVLKFGKHKGQKLNNIPFKYLAWLLIKYKGQSVPRKEIEDEAIRRGCTKINGKWGIDIKSARQISELGLIGSINIRGGFDENDCGFGTMYGVTRTFNEDKYNDAEGPDDDWYDYEGIPNFT